MGQQRVFYEATAQKELLERTTYFNALTDIATSAFGLSLATFTTMVNEWPNYRGCTRFNKDFALLNCWEIEHSDEFEELIFKTGGTLFGLLEYFGRDKIEYWLDGMQTTAGKLFEDNKHAQLMVMFLLGIQFNLVEKEKVRFTHALTLVRIQMAVNHELSCMKGNLPFKSTKDFSYQLISSLMDKDKLDAIGYNY